MDCIDDKMSVVTRISVSVGTAINYIENHSKQFLSEFGDAQLS